MRAAVAVAAAAVVFLSLSLSLAHGSLLDVSCGTIAVGVAEDGTLADITVRQRGLPCTASFSFPQVCCCSTACSSLRPSPLSRPPPFFFISFLFFLFPCAPRQANAPVALASSLVSPNVVAIRGHLDGGGGLGADVQVLLQCGLGDGHLRAVVTINGTQDAIWSTGVVWSVSCGSSAASSFWAPWDGSTPANTNLPLAPISPPASAFAWRLGTDPPRVSIPIGSLLDPASDTGLAIAVAPTQ